MDKNKIINRQFFTTNNPFILKPFLDWFNKIEDKKVILEPFAGSNNIPTMIEELADSVTWDCYDIELASVNNYPRTKIQINDSIQNFPTGYNISITNPPYLGKVSASTKHLPFPDCRYDDVYKLCLEKLLDNVNYVAAIIPETFIISKLFTERLDTVISLTCKMFDDTDCPVCLALFNKDKTEDFKIYRMDKFIGSYKELVKYIPTANMNIRFKFNDPHGSLGIKCIDTNSGPTIRFCDGEEIDSTKIKISSRMETRVDIPEDINLEELIVKANSILSEYRTKTEDVFLAPFKNLRKDNKYRRRLDFKTANLILNKAVEELKGI